MKKLNFTFKNDEDIIYKESVFFEKIGDYYTFNIDNNKFEICLDSFIHFKKITNSDIFEIIKKNDTFQALFTLREENMTFEVLLNDFEYKIKERNYIIKYTLESDPESIKTIILSID